MKFSCDTTVQWQQHKTQQFNAMLRRVTRRWTYGTSNSRSFFLRLRYVFNNSGIRIGIVCRWQNRSGFCPFELRFGSIRNSNRIRKLSGR